MDGWMKGLHFELCDVHCRLLTISAVRRQSRHAQESGTAAHLFTSVMNDATPIMQERVEESQ